MADMTKHLMETDEQIKLPEQRLIEDMKQQREQMLQPRTKIKKRQ